MHKHLALFSLLASTIALCVAQTPPPAPRSITVNGSVELKAIADQAALSFSVKGVGSSLRAAVQQATDKMEMITKLLRSQGIGAKQISTSQFYTGENYGDKSLFSSRRDYRAVIAAQVRVDSLQILQPVLYALADAEIESISSISFSLRDELGLKRRARTAAAAKAREKAQDIATALGASVGNVIAVEEIQLSGGGRAPEANVYRSAARFSATAPSPFNPVIVPGVDGPDVDESSGAEFFAQTVTAQSQVRVTFELR